MSIILDRPSVTAEEVALREDLVARAAKLVPLLAENAAQSEVDRKVVEENITAIEEAGLFSLMRPKRFGGLETDFRTKLEVSRELARGCGSTAWVTSLMNVCAWFVGLWPEQAQIDVWGNDPSTRVAECSRPPRQRRPSTAAFVSAVAGAMPVVRRTRSGRWSVSRSSMPTAGSSIRELCSFRWTR